MEKLSSRKCKACEGGIKPMDQREIAKYLSQLKGWQVSENHLVKEVKTGDFKEALKFVNKVGHIAEEEGHHPDICFSWGKVKIDLWTHAINGLSMNDFILAAKIDEITI